MGFWPFSGKKEKPPTDAERRSRLKSYGRITDGIIIDTETTASGDEIVFYMYSLNGVDFESSEILTDDQRREPLRFAPGAKVGIRYDPKNQGNSMLAQ